MDVRCNRCATEYDFDDALISERGTTVKCTNCGFQFKVFPPDAGALAPERWVVRTANGREHVFTSLRDLQRGITEQKVAANDLLSRGRQPPRPLGTIAELEQFFLAPRSQDRLQRTLHGVAPPASAPPATARGQVEASAAPSPHELPTVVAPPHTERFGKRSTTVPLGTPPEPQRSASSQRAMEEPPETAQTTNMPAAGNPYAGNTLATAAPPRVQPAYNPPPTISSTLQSAGAELPPSRGSQPDSDGGLPPRPELRSSPRISGPMALPGGPPPSRREFRSYDELSPESLPHPSRRARSRWIAAVVIVGVLLLFALTVGRRYLLQTRTAATETGSESDAKVAALLKSGTRLMDEGQLEEAGEQLLKATALAERNADVLAALARLSVLRADVHWLKLRLLDPQAEPLVQATHRELGRLIGKARSAVDAAFAIAPENIVVLRARVDALRLSGDQDTAREWIRPIASQSSEPANAYVLAALDLAETEPSWPSIIDRLKSAAAGEQTPGRAQVALTYALTRAGRIAEAQAELAKLESARIPPLLLDELKSFVQRHAETSEASPTEKRKAAVDPGKLGRPEPSPRAGAAPPATNDFRRLLEQAASALRGGDLTRAESLYQQVLAKNPGNTEALAGLGDVARRRNDPQAASRMYERVLADNPNYIPALLASADQKWDAGDRAGAVALYKRVLDQAGPSGEYGRRASARLAQANREAERRGEEQQANEEQQEQEQEQEQPDVPPSEGQPQAPTPAPAEPPPTTDTTDLPELK